MLVINFFQFIGKSVIDFYKQLFIKINETLLAILSLTRTPFYFKRFFHELLNIGLASVPIVALTAVFSGSVLALQSYVGFSRLDASNSIPLIVVLSMTRELGPVLTGLMLAGRISSNIASEVGSMQNTDQIDAMYIMGIDKNQYLLRPKLLSMLIAMPLLTLISDMLGVYGGYLVSVYKLGYNSALYQKQTFDFLKFEDVSSGLIKASCFGVIIILVGFYCGLYTNRNADGVGIATRNAVVLSTMLILVANYGLTYWLFS